MRSLPFALVLGLLLAGCSQGLSEDEKRAAKAHADNICLMSKQGNAMGELVQQVAGLSDMAQVHGAGSDKESRYVVEGTRKARERGCVK